MGIWGSKVVVVDDDLDTLELVRCLLRLQGAQVVGVSTPGEALTTVIGVMPEVLLVDIAMPGEDGYALIRQVRALASDRGGRIPAAALTAYATLEDRRRALLAGYNEHIPKPVDPTRLIATVAGLIPAN